MTIPCGCCPTGLSRCYAPTNPLTCNLPATVAPLPTIATPDSAQVIANPLGWTFTGSLAVTHDGAVSPGTVFWRINNGASTADSQVRVRWSYSQPQPRAYAFQVFHGGGGVLNDGDGISSANLTLYDAGLGVLHGPVPIVSGNSGAGFVTDFSPPGPFVGTRHFELSDIREALGGAPNIHIREVRLLLRWAATITYTCPPFTMIGNVEADTDTQASGITMPAGMLNQTNGPHTITWSVPPGVTGTVTTNNPGNFSTLTVVDGTVMTVSGNQNNQFAVTWVSDDLDDIALPAHGLLCDGEVTWFDGDGTEIPPILLRDCPPA